ncbi:MAG TPA: hypothetical protein PLU88_08205 [Armatimonadota bacterium]|nr:hypothetical protein [Armatimonadota bacterium]
MTNGWFVFALMTCIVLCTGLVLAIAIMKAAWAQKEREALTSSDLRALEESAVLLIEQLKTEADSVIAEIDKRAADLRTLLEEADRKLKRLDQVYTSSVPDFAETDESFECDISHSNSDRDQILALSDKGLDSAAIAKKLGLDCAQVKLVLSLSKLPAVR